MGGASTAGKVFAQVHAGPGRFRVDGDVVHDGPHDPQTATAVGARRPVAPVAVIGDVDHELVVDHVDLDVDRREVRRSGVLDASPTASTTSSTAMLCMPTE